MPYQMLMMGLCGLVVMVIIYRHTNPVPARIPIPIENRTKRGK